MVGNKLSVSVISPEKIIYSGDADSVNLPGVNGELGILWNHAPLISELGVGVVKIMDNNDPIVMAIDGGFVEIRNNQINILANSGEIKENIKEEIAKNMLEEAEKMAPSLEKQKLLKKAKTRISLLK